MARERLLACPWRFGRRSRGYSRAAPEGMKHRDVFQTDTPRPETGAAARRYGEGRAAGKHKRFSFSAKRRQPVLREKRRKRNRNPRGLWGNRFHSVQQREPALASCAGSLIRCRTSSFKPCALHAGRVAMRTFSMRIYFFLPDQRPKRYKATSRQHQIRRRMAMMKAGIE